MVRNKESVLSSSDVRSVRSMKSCWSSWNTLNCCKRRKADVSQYEALPGALEATPSGP